MASDISEIGKAKDPAEERQEIQEREEERYQHEEHQFIYLYQQELHRSIR